MKNVLNIKLFAFMAILLGTTLFISCNKNESISEPEIETDYSELSVLLKNSLEDIGQNLRNQNATFKSHNDVIWAAEQYFANDVKTYDAFSTTYDKVTNNSNLKSTVYNEVISKVLDEIELGLLNSNSSNEFVNFLEEKFDEISKSELQIENKKSLLQYIISYKTAIEFINDNVDILTPDGQLKSVQAKWWDNWGKCAASILGGAGTGALTFGLGGAAVGTIALPVIGTVSAGTVGAIGGAIAGGLTGAAASC